MANTLAATRAIRAAQITHDRTGSDLRSYSASVDAARSAGANFSEAQALAAWAMRKIEK